MAFGIVASLVIMAARMETPASPDTTAAASDMRGQGVLGRVSIVTSAYNEAGNLRQLIERVEGVLPRIKGECEMVVANDGSKDGSAAILDELASTRPWLRVVHLARNYGQTAALMAAFQHATGEIVVALDADLQNDPDDIPMLLEKMGEGFDLVSGWRKDRQDHAIKRNLLSRVANGIICGVSGVHLHDYGCTLKAYRAAITDDMKLYGEMHRFIPIYAHWLGARITEIPVKHHPRTAGVSKYGMERTVKVLLDLFVVMFLHRFANKPIYLFGAAGILFWVTAFIAGVWALGEKLINHISLIQTPLPLVAVFGAMTGVICFLMGLLAELSIRTYHESQNKPTYRVARVVNFQNPAR